MVTLVVAIDRELLRRVNASLHPDLAAEGIARVQVGEEGLHFIRKNVPESELQTITSWDCFQSKRKHLVLQKSRRDTCLPMLRIRLRRRGGFLAVVALKMRKLVPTRTKEVKSTNIEIYPNIQPGLNKYPIWPKQMANILFSSSFFSFSSNQCSIIVKCVLCKYFI